MARRRTTQIQVQQENDTRRAERRTIQRLTPFYLGSTKTRLRRASTERADGGGDQQRPSKGSPRRAKRSVAGAPVGEEVGGRHPASARSTREAGREEPQDEEPKPMPIVEQEARSWESGGSTAATCKAPGASTTKPAMAAPVLRKEREIAVPYLRLKSWTAAASPTTTLRTRPAEHGPPPRSHGGRPPRLARR